MSNGNAFEKALCLTKDETTIVVWYILFDALSGICVPLPLGIRNLLKMSQWLGLPAVHIQTL